MRLFKSDYRYKLHNQGFHHIIQFRWHNGNDTHLYRKIVEQLVEQYGPQVQDEYDERYVVNRKWNENFRYEQNVKNKRRRIYLKNEVDATLILLKVQQ